MPAEEVQRHDPSATAPPAAEELVRRALEANPLIGSPGAARSEFYADGFQFHSNLIQTASLEAFSDIEVSFDEIVSHDDRVTIRYTARGRHTGEFRGLPPTDRWMDVRGIAVLRIADGQIAEGWGSLNWA